MPRSHGNLAAEWGPGYSWAWQLCYGQINLAAADQGNLKNAGATSALRASKNLRSTLVNCFEDALSYSSYSATTLAGQNHVIAVIA